jgi:leucyl-tRNA synthetase
LTPHITEELWQHTGHTGSIHLASWPTWDESVAAEEMVTLIVQVNGRVRDRIEVPAGIGNDEAQETALASESVQRHLAGTEVVKVVVVPGRLVNVVAR